MERKVVMWIIIGVLVIAVVFMTLKAPSNGGQLVSSAGQAVAQAVAPASSGMVGGC